MFFYCQAQKKTKTTVKLIVPVAIEIDGGGNAKIALLPNADNGGTTPTHIGAYKYNVISIVGGSVELMPLYFDKGTNNAKAYNNKIFTISKTDYDKFAEVVEDENDSKISIGLLTLPFKARPQKEFAFDTEFNFNSTLNIRLDKFSKDFSLNWQLGAGIGTVGLNPDNAKGIEEGESTDVSTVTFLTGFMYQYKNVQFGLYSGLDFINNQDNYNWDGHGNPWVAMGIGFNLFKIDIENKVKQVNDFDGNI
ncbi:hypothetical protein EM932_06385 [Flavivirga rizhaonensis]|uniref:Uncharacterized protein n=2 Tax=Flavivirga rizhaonensis TaxID=2559571 RepID=A0A4S1DZQ0_9FLAO|nr:hypothetical protein EM932_06385 [Flavivirga rizhaonensis]